jgi:UPF0716 family protein affecting phage T7 exclusion
MRSLRLYFFFGLGMIGWASAGHAADEAAQNGGASAAAWIMLLAPTLFVILLLFPLMRRARSQHAMSTRSLAQWEEHPRVTEEHMRRLESQIDRLDGRLSRVVELLETLGRDPGQSRG